MKKILFLILTLSLFNLHAQTEHPGVAADPESTDIMGGSTPGGAQTRNNSQQYEELQEEEEKKDAEHLNSVQKMEERDNNSSIQTESPRNTDSDGENYDRARNDLERKAQKKDNKRSDY
jgi:hypothetical protein